MFERFVVNRLFEIVDGPKLHRFDRGVNGSKASQHDRRDANALLAKRSHYVERGQVAEVQVSKQQIESPGSSRGEPCPAAVGQRDGVPQSRQKQARQLAPDSVVFDHQYLGHPEPRGPWNPMVAKWP